MELQNDEHVHEGARVYCTYIYIYNNIVRSRLNASELI